MAYTHITLIGDDTEADRLLNKYLVENSYGPYIEIGEDKYCMSIEYKKWADRLNKFEVKEDDTFIIAFPRSGTTWTQEMVWLIVNNLNFEGAKEPQAKRIPFLEMDTLPKANTDGLNSSLLINTSSLSYINEMKSPRCIKSHLPWSLLPKQITNGSKCPKIIYILRNPKDVCISYYNLYRLFDGYNGTLDDFCTLFLAGRVIHAPFWKSVLSIWEQRHRSNILFIRYENMKKDLRCEIKRVSEFLGKHVTEKQMDQLVEHLNIENMRHNPAVNRDDAIEKYAMPFKRMTVEKNNFIGRGESNGYLSIMSPELINKFDDWSKQHLEHSDLRIE